ncbi:MAG: HD domain-containing response regulator [Christensenellales bacterium]|jgi:putative nucleotidyltransferase with HDIG domain
MRKNRPGFMKNGFTMMTVDDDPNITDALKAYFEASGYQVDTETDPARALERMKKKQYDILLLDFIMRPFCGDVFVSRLRQFDPKVFVILLTGHKELAPPLDTIRELDIQGYYEKSERFDQLELLVESCIKSIKQMRLIGSYQDGLSQILGATPSILKLMPLEDLTGRISEHLKNLYSKCNSFVLVKAWRITPHPETEDVPETMFSGNGRYNISLQEFRESITRELRVDIEATMEFCRPIQSDSHIIAPLLNQNSHPVCFGVIAIEKSVRQSDASMPLLSVYAEQVSTALNNTMLHMQLNRKNAQLTQAYAQMTESYMQTIEALRLMVDAKDIYTRGHSDRVAFYSSRLAQRISSDEGFLERVKIAGLLHDVGKVAISDTILTKPSTLSNEEFGIIKSHTNRGASILERITLFSEIAHIVRSHHERYDGGGYPDGLAGNEIPIESRIIAIADAFDAMMSSRHYREALTLQKAIDELTGGKGSQFDPFLIDEFLPIAKDYPALSQELQWTYKQTERMG